MNSDALVQVISAAAMIRAAELAHGSNFTPSQMGLYIENYKGRYPKKTIEGAVGMLVLQRTKKRSLFSKFKYILGFSETSWGPLMEIEDQANKILKMPGVADDLRMLVANNFVRKPQ